MHTEFEPWLADGKACHDHIVEFIKKSNPGKMFLSILKENADDLATDCWIWIWEGSCVARSSVKGAYDGSVKQTWKDGRKARMTVKVATTYFLRHRAESSSRAKVFKKQAYQEMLMNVSIKDTGEKVQFDLAKEERVLMLWNAGELSTDEAMEKLSLTSRQSLYTRFEVLVQRLKMELQDQNIV